MIDDDRRAHARSRVDGALGSRRQAEKEEGRAKQGHCQMEGEGGEEEERVADEYVEGDLLGKGKASVL